MGTVSEDRPKVVFFHCRKQNSVNVIGSCSSYLTSRVFMSSRADYYGILGVGRHASQAQIRSAFLAAVRCCHPDLNPDYVEIQGADFKRLRKAYEILSDPRTRADYDRDCLLSRIDVVTSSSDSARVQQIVDIPTPYQQVWLEPSRRRTLESLFFLLLAGVITGAVVIGLNTLRHRNSTHWQTTTPSVDATWLKDSRARHLTDNAERNSTTVTSEPATGVTAPDENSNADALSLRYPKEADSERPSLTANTQVDEADQQLDSEYLEPLPEFSETGTPQWQAILGEPVDSELLRLARQRLNEAVFDNANAATQVEVSEPQKNNLHMDLPPNWSASNDGFFSGNSGLPKSAAYPESEMSRRSSYRQRTSVSQTWRSRTGDFGSPFAKEPVGGPSSFARPDHSYSPFGQGYARRRGRQLGETSDDSSAYGDAYGAEYGNRYGRDAHNTWLGGTHGSPWSDGDGTYRAQRFHTRPFRADQVPRNGRQTGYQQSFGY